MTMIFADSFSGYATADMVGMGKYAASGTQSGTLSISTSGGRNGDGCLQHTSQDWAYLRRAFGANLTRAYVGFAFKANSQLPSTAIPLFSFMDTTTHQCVLWLLTDGRLQIRNGSGTVLGTSATALSFGVWYFIEYEATIHNTTGTFSARINEVSVISGTGANTRNTSNNYMTTFQLGGDQGNTRNHFFCDLYVNDSNGSVNNGFLGDIRVILRLASAAGDTTAWTPSTGSNYACVDDAQQNGDTDYVSSSVINDVDTYAMQDLPANAGTVYAVIPFNVARKDDAGTVTLAPVLRPGSTDRVGTARTLSTSYTFSGEVNELNPDTAAAWTAAEFNATKVGIKKVS